MKNLISESYIQNKYASIIWKALTAFVGYLGLFLCSNILTGNPNMGMFGYFTNISNLFSALYFTYAAIVTIKDKSHKTITVLPAVKGIIMMSLTVTMLIAHFLLTGAFSANGSFSPYLLCLHYIAPIMVILDWLFFDNKGMQKKFYPFIWVIAPLFYLGVIMILAQTTAISFGSSKYPYGFIDISIHGVPTVMITVLVLVVIFILLGYIFLLLDYLLSKLKKKP